jgi:excisionase family DNA binding protein
MKEPFVENGCGELSRQFSESESLDSLMSIEELAKTLGVCSRSVRRAVDRKELPQPVKVGNAVRFFKSEVLAYLRRLREQRAI